MSMSSGLTFDLSIDPNDRFVATVRRFVEGALERLMVDPDGVFRVAMTAHELLDNAVKHSVAGSVLLRFAARIEPEQALINLSVINETTPSHIDRLRETINAIGGAQSAFAHYRRLLPAATRMRGDAGLGLARIAAQAEIMLGLEIKGTTVAVMASTRASALGAW